MLFDQVGEEIELRRADRGNRGVVVNEETVPSGMGGHLAKPRATECIRFQQAVQMGAPDRPACGALRARGSVQLEPGRITAAPDPTMVNLVAVHGNSITDTAAGAAPQHLRLGEFDLQIQQTQPHDRPRIRFDPIDDATPEHLISAADAQDRPSRCRPGPERISDSGAPQPLQIRNGRFTAWQHHQIGIGQPGRVADPTHGHTGLTGQRFDIGGIGDARQPDRGDGEPFGADRRTGTADRGIGDCAEGVLRIDPQVVRMRNDTESRASCQFGEPVESGTQQLDITAELIDDEAADQLLVFGFQYGNGAEEVREHAAAVDITDHEHRQSRRARQSHVRQIGGAQVDFGGRTGTLADHHIEFGAQRIQFGGNHFAQILPMPEIVARTDGGNCLAAHHELGAPVTAGFEQHRIEPHTRLQPARRRLQRLCATDLTTVEGDHRVIGHVLRFERSDSDTAPSEHSAESRHHNAFSGVGGRSRDQ